jgi:hypothetical protein
VRPHVGNHQSLTSGTTTINTLFNNTGSVNVQSGTLDLNGGGTATGAFTVQPGATLNFSQGTYTVQPQAHVGGGGTVLFTDNSFFGGSTYYINTTSFSPASTIISNGIVNFGANVTLPSLTQTGGTLTGSGTVTVSGPLDWTGGTMAGSGLTIANSTLTIDTSSGNPNLSGRTLENTLSGALTGSGTFSFSNGGNLANLKGATFTIQGTPTVQGGGTITNAGTFRAAAPSTSQGPSAITLP